MAELDRLAVLDEHLDDLAGALRLDLVHHLHRLDDADDALVADALPHSGEGVRLGRRRGVEGADHRGGDLLDGGARRASVAGPPASPPLRGASPRGRLAALHHHHRGRGVAAGRTAAEMDPQARLVVLDLEFVDLAALHDAHEVPDEFEVHVEFGAVERLVVRWGGERRLPGFGHGRSGALAASRIPGLTPHSLIEGPSRAPRGGRTEPPERPRGPAGRAEIRPAPGSALAAGLRQARRPRSGCPSCFCHVVDRQRGDRRPHHGLHLDARPAAAGGPAEDLEAVAVKLVEADLHEVEPQRVASG